jgi:DNA-directed RNA polymerase subunit RPC12/RpoP
MAASQRNLILGVIIVIGFGAAAYSFVFRGRRDATAATQFTEAGVCLSCKTEGEVTYPRQEAAPHKCPKCGTPAFYPWYFCFDCQKRFVPALVRRDPGGPLRLPLGIACTSCGGTNVSVFLPNQADYRPSGDAPLPKWP